MICSLASLTAVWLDRLRLLLLNQHRHLSIHKLNVRRQGIYLLMQDQRFFTAIFTPLMVEANVKLSSLPSLVVYLPSSFWSRSTPITQTLSFEPVSFSALASWKIPCPVVAAA